VTRTIPPKQLDWLEGELARWQAEGRLDPTTAADLRGDYTASRRFSLARLLLGIGGGFVGIGLIWLVAANLDSLSPLTRIAGVVVLWLAAVGAAELLDARRNEERDAVVGSLRGVAALAFGAVVFQAAQSLQVPAYDSGLLGAWAAGALVYAYAATAVAPLLVGIVTGVGWYAWAVTEWTQSAAGAVVALLLAAVAAAALAVAHGPARLPAFAAPWRLAAALLGLSALFVAALPIDKDADLPARVWLVVAVVLAAAAASALVADRIGRGEIAAAVGVACAGVLLLLWDPPGGSNVAELSGEALMRAVVAILLYLLAAVWIAALGVLRDARGLTQLATAALVVFTVVQSFAVFEPILSGAALFLVLGAVLASAGYLVDRGRRRLVTEVREVSA
jgi:uncharacterized membrane protein